MFNFSKSRLDSDLQNKTDVQFKVMTDWLRAIDRKINLLTRQTKSISDNLAKIESYLYDYQLSSPEGEQDVPNDNSSDTRTGQ